MFIVVRNALFIIYIVISLFSSVSANTIGNNSNVSEDEIKQKIDKLIGSSDAKLKHDRKKTTEEAIKLLPLVKDNRYKLDILYAHFASVCMSGDESPESEVIHLFNETTTLANQLDDEAKLYYSYHYMIYYYEKGLKYKQSYQLVSEMYKLAIESGSFFGLVHSKLVEVNTARVLQRYDRVLSLGSEILTDTQKLFALGYGKSATGVEKQITSYIAEALFELDQLPEAIAMYKSLINKHPDNFNIRYTFVDLLYSKAEWDKAEVALNNIINIDSQKHQLEVNKANIARLKGELQFSKQNFQEAIPLLEEFIASKNVGGFRRAITSSKLLLAKAYSELGNFALSAKYFKSWSDEIQTEREQQLKQNIAYLSVELETQQSQFLRKEAEQKLKSEQSKMRWQLAVFWCLFLLLSAVVWGVVRTNKKLNTVANIDPLTKIPNRRFAFNYIEHLIGETKEEDRHCIAIVDIDDFKTINDSFGHDIGDKVLTQLAQTFRRFLRPTDIIARLGGEEFVIVFPNTDIKGAITRMDALRHAMEMSNFDKALKGRKITISAGLSELSRAKDGIEWLKKADIALYESKRNGKNRVEVFTAVK